MSMTDGYYDTDQDDELDEETDVEPQAPAPSDLRKKLKEANKRASEVDKLQAELAGYKRKAVISDAGLKLNDKQMAALFAVHGDAELTKDAILATAVELGYVENKAQENLETQDRIANASTGAEAPGAAGEVDFAEAIANASSPEEVMDLAQRAGRMTSWNLQ